MEKPEDEEIEVGEFLSERNFDDIVIVKIAIAQSQPLLKRLLRQVIEEMIAEGELCLFVDGKEDE